MRVVKRVGQSVTDTSSVHQSRRHVKGVGRGHWPLNTAAPPTCFLLLDPRDIFPSSCRLERQSYTSVLLQPVFTPPSGRFDANAACEKTKQELGGRHWQQSVETET